MTGALADLGLSKEAKSQLDAYLGEVRTALAEVPDVNLDEIESDIREHVEQELRSALRPIPSAILEGVLNRLGPPTQWLPPGHRTAPLPSLFGYFKAKAIAAFSALWRGPEDWRLAYLSFFIFALGVVLVPVFPLMLIVSYLLARAGIAAAHQKGFEVDAARKWLLYPQLLLVGVILLPIIAFGPPISATISAVHQTQELDTRERWQDKTVVQKVQIERGKFVDKEVTIKWLNPEVLTTPDRIFARFPVQRLSVPRSQRSSSQSGCLRSGRLRSAYWPVSSRSSFGLPGFRSCSDSRVEPLSAGD